MEVKITRVICDNDIVEKINREHHVNQYEVEEVFVNQPKFRRGPKDLSHKDIRYYALGQTNSGRYLFIVFSYKGKGQAKIITAREMEAKERRLYKRK
ncbi:MAG: BrnT family toxin [bacterium]